MCLTPALGITLIALGVILGIVLIVIGIYATRHKADADPLQRRLAEYSDREMPASLDELELSLDLSVSIWERFGNLLVRLGPRRRDALGDTAKTETVVTSQVDSAASSTAPDDGIHFAAFYPEVVQPAQTYILMVFAHVETAFNEISKIAAGFEGLMGGKAKHDLVQSLSPVSIGSLLTFVPQIDGIVMNPSEQVMTWQPPYQSANFLFSVPGQMQIELIRGRVLIFQGPLIIGEIPVEMTVLGAGAPSTKGLPRRSSFEQLDPVFASYSHKDTPVMEYFRQARENLGRKMLVDIYDLRAGEHWQERLLGMIDESAVFQLFWSEHSAKSEYCRREWQYALQYQDSRPRFLQPIWWKAPMPIPPDELSHIHFQKVNVPS